MDKHSLFILALLIYCISIFSHSAFGKTQYVVERPMLVDSTRNMFFEGNFFAVRSFDDTEFSGYLAKDGTTFEFRGNTIPELEYTGVRVLGPGIASNPVDIATSDPTDYCYVDQAGFQQNVDIAGWEGKYRSNGAWLRYVDKITDLNDNKHYVGFFHSETNGCYSFQTPDEPEHQHVRMSLGFATRGLNTPRYWPRTSPLFPINYDPYINGDEPADNHYTNLKSAMGLAQASLTRTQEYYYMFFGVNNNALSVARFPLTPNIQDGKVNLWKLRAQNQNFVNGWEKFCGSNTQASEWVAMDDVSSDNQCKTGEYFRIAQKEQANGISMHLGRSPAYDLTVQPSKLLLISTQYSRFGISLTESNTDVDVTGYNPENDLSIMEEPLVPYHGIAALNDDNRYVADHYANPSIVANNGGNRIDGDSFYIFYRYNQKGFLLKHGSTYYREVSKLDVPSHHPKAKIALARYRSSSTQDTWDSTKDAFNYSSNGAANEPPVGEQYNYERNAGYLWTKKVSGKRMRLLCDATKSGDKWVRYIDYSYDQTAGNLYNQYCIDSDGQERILGWIIPPDGLSDFDFSKAELLKLARCDSRAGNSDSWIRDFNAHWSDETIQALDPSCTTILGYAMR